MGTLRKSIQHSIAVLLIELEIRAGSDYEPLFSLPPSSHSKEDHLYLNKPRDMFSSLS